MFYDILIIEIRVLIPCIYQGVVLVGKQANKLYNIYVPNSKLDWMNYKIDRKQDLTFHHIVKREDGGKATLDNGALLTYNAHNYLHVIEFKEIDTYNYINKMFEIINKQLSEPNEDQRFVIEYLLRQFEERHKNDLNRKGKPLIKDDWLKRW